ncbi:multiple ankyrin repeats single kh domain [Pelomyxa schiedti]|nr:multiple ankyrin repeats single kh domain [Pelomyxa schiedti]
MNQPTRNSWGPYSKLPMIEACKSRNPDIIKAVIAAGANPNIGYCHRFDPTQGAPHSPTPLMWACDHKQANIVRVLLENGADPNRKNDRSHPLAEAVAHKHNFQIVQMLLQKGANPNTRCGPEKMLCPIHFVKSADIMELMLKHGADPNCGGGLGAGVTLMANCYHQNFGVVKCMLDHGANPELQPDGTPLCHAITGGWDEGVQLLLSSGAQANGYCKICKRFPLQTAAIYDRDLHIDLLLQFGATDTHNPYAYLKECRRGKFELAIKIVNTPNAVNDREAQLGLILIQAILKGKSQIVKRLLAMGIPPETKWRTAEGPQSPLSIPSIHKDEEIFQAVLHWQTFPKVVVAMTSFVLGTHPRVVEKVRDKCPDVWAYLHTYVPPICPPT